MKNAACRAPDGNKVTAELRRWKMATAQSSFQQKITRSLQVIYWDPGSEVNVSPAGCPA